MIKANQKGFTALEVVLALMLFGVICGVSGYVISQQNETSKPQTNSSVDRQAEKNKSANAGVDDLITYGPDGVSVIVKTDVEKLTNAEGAFKSYIASQVGDKPTYDEFCDQPTVYTVHAIYKNEFASGGVGSCGGAAQIWKKQAGNWSLIWGGQESLPCSIANEHRIPQQISDKCWDEQLGGIRNPN